MICFGIAVLADRISIVRNTLELPIVREIAGVISLPLYLLLPISLIYEYALLELIDYRAEIEKGVVIFQSKLLKHKEIGLKEIKCLEMGYQHGKSVPRLELTNGKHIYLSRITNSEEFVKKILDSNIEYVNHRDI